MNNVHTSVLSEEICDWLNLRSHGIYVDCTLGAGGLSYAILNRLSGNAHILAVDRDSEAVAYAKKVLSPYQSSLTFINGNFSHISDYTKNLGFECVDGIVFDLGVSSMQLDQPGRGFSFGSEGPLDMRMDQRQGPTAADLVNSLPEPDLAQLIYSLGEERYSRRIAREIVQARKTRVFRTTQDLVSAIYLAVPSSYRHGRIHFATRTFQALRIRVNQELDLLEPALRNAIRILKVGGRMCVVAFHSLEDRIVKHTFRSLAKTIPPSVAVLTKKPITPSEQEIQSNPRARSGKLRVITRLSNEVPV